MSASETIQIAQQLVAQLATLAQIGRRMMTKLYLIKIQILSGQLPTHNKSLWVDIEGRVA